MRLKHPHAAVRETAAWHTYLGHRVSRSGIEPSRQMLRKMQQRIGAHVLTGDTAKIERSMASYLGILGVVRDARGRGLAPALLTAVLRATQEAGLERVVLDVDTESPTGALGLYESVGFVPTSRSIDLVLDVVS